ncbi:hypothetical protein LXL04_038103 [Taraxacum kok-saghyz]
MSNPAKANHEDNVVRVWKSQFPKEVKRIRLTHVIEKIVNDSEAGPSFIMNFLVLYVSVMIGFPSMGMVNQTSLENIKLDITRLDWCGFVLSCLNSTRMMWNRLDDKCVFHWTSWLPSVNDFDLFYLRYTKIDYIEKQVKTHPLIYWTTERLKERESQEIENGRFGNLVVLAEDMDCEMNKKTVPTDLENIKHILNTYYQAIEDLDVWLEIGQQKFPESEAIHTLIDTRKHKFNLTSPDLPTSLTCGIIPTSHAKNHHEADANEGRRLQPKVMDTEEPDTKDVSTNLLKVKKSVKVTDKLRSPNFIRVIDLHSGIKTIDGRVSGMIFAGIGNEWDLLFESKYGDKGFRAIFESMIPGSKLHISIIDLWATILNHEEQRRNKNSPSRLFVSCTLLGVLFDLYLAIVKHPKRSTMKRMRPVKFTRSWMTKRNYTHCGIFLMRHMETYKGEDIDDWDVDLADEGDDSDKQQIQLDDLRRKYVTKILTSDLNKLKPNVYNYIPQYDKLPLEKKIEIDTNEHFDRMQARINLFD